VSAGARREEARLRRVFERALRLAAVAAPGALALGCGAPAPEDGAVDEAAAALERRSCAPVKTSPEPPDTCGDYVRLPCGLPSGVVPGSRCYLWLNDCQKVCPGIYFNCHAVDDSCVDGGIVTDSAGGVTIDCATCAKGVGRVPAGLAPARFPRAPSALGDHFAVVAHLEAASVASFRRLGAELRALGAPTSLVRAARRARRDEVRHALVTGRMARRFGGAPVRPRVERLPARPLDVVALENAVEGCVRETLGALVARWQADHAGDPAIARLMGAIARDETRHAALSWAVARWAARRLDAAARAGIGARCREAIASLRREADADVPCELVARAGLPGPTAQRALVGSLETELWRMLAP
jgi:hypothetical protein